jgi:RNA polymerase sigma factor (sigma-70 family)
MNDGDETRFDLSPQQVLATIRESTRRHGVDRADVDDFVHNCFAEVQYAIPRFKGGSSQGFVRELVHRQALLYIRRRASGRRNANQVDAASRANAQIKAVSPEITLSLRAALETLDPLERELIHRHDVMGVPLHEAASSIDLSPPHAYEARRRALHKLRRMLGSRCGLYIVLPCALAAACTLLAVELPPIFARNLHSIQEALGCFARDMPVEIKTLLRDDAPCTRRDRAYEMHAVRLLQHPRFASATLSLFNDYLADVESDQALLFGDLLRASGLDLAERSRAVADLRDGMVSAHAHAADSPLTEDLRLEAPVAASIAAAGFVPTTQRSFHTLERVAVDFCDDDVGWELGCDSEELVVMSVVLGEHYFACGISPALGDITAKTPFEGRLRFANGLEFGRRPARVHAFTSVIDLDPGGGTLDEMLRAVAVATMAAYALKGETFGQLARADADAIRDLLTMALRIISSENDVREFVDAPHTGDDPVNIILNKWPTGSYLIEMRLSGH